MGDSSPDRVSCEVDSLKPPGGRVTIQLEAPLKPISPEVAAAMLALLGGGLPVGLLAPFAGATAPSGWVLCDGGTLARDTYDALFAVIGATYGPGDGSTTFNVPDLRGRVAAGMDNMGTGAATRLTGGTRGASLGAEGVALDATQIPAHTHTQPPHTHGLHVAAGSGVAAGGDFNLPSIGVSGATVTTEAGGGDATGSTGDGSSHPNVQPTLVVNYIIKT